MNSLSKKTKIGVPVAYSITTSVIFGKNIPNLIWVALISTLSVELFEIIDNWQHLNFEIEKKTIMKQIHVR